MRILLVLIAMVSLFAITPTSVAVDVGVIGTTILTDPLVSEQDIDVNVDINADGPTETVIKFFVNETLLQTIDFNFETAGPTTLNFHWTNPQNDNHTLK